MLADFRKFRRVRRVYIQPPYGSVSRDAVCGISDESAPVSFAGCIAILPVVWGFYVCGMLQASGAALMEYR